MHHYRSALISWLPLGVAITLICLLIEVTVQQNYRNDLDDPQTQIAEDTARVVSAGFDPTQLAPKGNAIEISASLGTWVAFYDEHLAPQASTGLLHGVIPSIPAGVFATAKEQGAYAVTWQPEPSVRQALVVVPAGNKGYAVSGRNMRAVEERESRLATTVLIGWALTMIATFVTAYFAGSVVERMIKQR